jgi:hypothetical protein
MMTSAEENAACNRMQRLFIKSTWSKFSLNEEQNLIDQIFLFSKKYFSLYFKNYFNAEQAL